MTRYFLFLSLPPCSFPSRTDAHTALLQFNDHLRVELPLKSVGNENMLSANCDMAHPMGATARSLPRTRRPSRACWDSALRVCIAICTVISCICNTTLVSATRREESNSVHLHSPHLVPSMRTYAHSPVITFDRFLLQRGSHKRKRGFNLHVTTAGPEQTPRLSGKSRSVCSCTRCIGGLQLDRSHAHQPLHSIVSGTKN